MVLKPGAHSGRVLPSMQALLQFCLIRSLGLELQGPCFKGVPGEGPTSTSKGVYTKEGRQASEFSFISVCAFVSTCNQFLSGAAWL